ncbi:DGQHR domain-containing protein [Actinomadura darangshiensis]|uniref:DGQHR domain-containing protein n=1 Tax=Actinomadura darangshiensis TaxID=705336 RepID=A0A4R5BU93_9ACTN|nr:DNA sulfur modification protein DndB [Actinomadura darangshiensis]TDD89093.1 DGQHR domain-containing protein [Actinomadura darangshiensis]
MANTVPAIKGKMGSIEFYNTKLRASDLAAIARAASKGDDWANLSIEERLQRKLNEKRVRDELVPYLANSPDRFFGSIIILVYEPATFAYEDFGKWLKDDTPAAYMGVIGQMGVLTIDGGDLIVLDGQHRWAALRLVVNRKDDKDKDINGDFVSAVRDDELSVIFVPFINNETTRRIFNKINKSAKPTGRSDNIITSEDDGYAILTRKLLAAGEPLGVTDTVKGELIVNWKSNTLGDRSAQLTTVSAVYETVKAICKEYSFHFEERDRIIRPGVEELDKAYENVSHWWGLLLQYISVFKEAIDNPDKITQLRTKEANNLLVKPATHIALVRGLLIAARRYSVKESQAVKRINKIDWDMSSDLWKNILVYASGERIIARNENYLRAAELIAYLLAGASDRYPAETRDQLRVTLASMKGEPGYQLPPPVA